MIRTNLSSSLRDSGLVSFAQKLLGVSAAIFLLASAGSLTAQAVGIPTNLEATFSGTDGSYDWEVRPILSPNADNGSFSVELPDQDNYTYQVSNISISGNVDPFILTSFSVQNTTGVTQNYTFIFTIPIVPQLPTTLTGGSVGITITSDGDGATLDTHSNGRPTYYSQIDGGDYVLLNLAPIIEPDNFDSTTASANFGTPIPNLPGPAALATIGIRYDFSLTPNDVAAVTGSFVVEAIPEPATCLLLMAGVAGCLTIRRR